MTIDQPSGHGIGEAQQGALFSEQVVNPGTTEPDQFTPETHLEVAPDGVFPEPAVQTETATDEDLAASVHAAVVTDHRHKGQLGKHSPLERSGSYSADLEVGDVLPGFGPVRYSNFNAAERYAHELDSDKSSKKKKK